MATFKQHLLRLYKNKYYYQKESFREELSNIIDSHELEYHLELMNRAIGVFSTSALHMVRTKFERVKLDFFKGKDILIPFPTNKDDMSRLANYFDKHNIIWESGAQFSKLEPWTLVGNANPTGLIVKTHGRIVWTGHDLDHRLNQNKIIMTIDSFIKFYNDFCKTIDACADYIFANVNYTHGIKEKKVQL